MQKYSVTKNNLPYIIGVFVFPEVGPSKNIPYDESVITKER